VYKVDIPYKDYFDGDKEKIETLYFNLTAFELAEIAVEFESEGGIKDYMTKSLESENYKNAFKVLKMLFVGGYGRRQEIGDRVRFIKKPEWLLEILPSPEFGAFYMKVTTDNDFAEAFWNGLAPPELMEQAAKIQEIEELKAKPTQDGKKFRDLTLQEQMAEIQAKIAANETKA
jgi:hypothetical protein